MSHAGSRALKRPLEKSSKWKRSTPEVPKGNAKEARIKYLTEKAAMVELPTDEAAELNPKFLFDAQTVAIQMCLQCRIANRQLEMGEVDEENQILGINMCKVCRAHFKTQCQQRFYRHDMLCFKRAHS